jgi:type II secretory pathway component PulK
MALIVVIWTMTFFGIVLSAFAFSMRTELDAARGFAEEAQAAALAEAGIARAIADLMNGRVGGVGPSTASLPFDSGDVPLGRGSYRILVADEEGKIALNRAHADTLARLLENTGVSDSELRRTIVDAILDWRDADHDHHVHGAEREYYGALLHPYAPRNRDFPHLDELLLVKGMRREILDGTVTDDPRRAALLATSPQDRDFRPGEYLGIRSFVTVHGTGRVNINAASLDVLVAIGIGAVEAEALLEGRRGGRLAGQLPAVDRGSATTRSSGVYRIESVGRLAAARARYPIAATVQIIGRPLEPHLRVLSWTEGS